MAKLTVVTPAFNERENLPHFYRRLVATENELGMEWEWIVVDDHSSDDTFAVVEDLSLQDDRVKGIRVARNSGSHVAIACGLDHASGNCAVVMTADLQDPPEEIPKVLSEWHNGFHVVWAARAERKGEKKKDIMLARLFYFIMRNLAGVKNMPPTGSDFFLVDRLVVEAIKKLPERNLNLFALVNWLGFKQTIIYYNKEARLHGSSGWTIRKKVKLLLDSITSFSLFPIRFMTLVGICISLMGLLYSLVIILNALIGNPPSGWSSLMVVLLFLGGFQILMLGVLGEYLWRTLTEARQRPRYIIESRTRSIHGKPSEKIVE